MQLSKDIIGRIVAKPGVEIPDVKLFELPEKVLQFGTGVLLRGLPDFFIDKANKQGLFNGRVVMIKSTDSDSSAFDTQDGLYTICTRGIEDGVKVEENIVNSSVSRVLSAKTDWQRILECAHNPEMKIIISNTTEVGIQLVQDDVTSQPPISFPGKLLAFLYERYKAFNGSKASGMIIIPTELITDNGSKLESIVLELAHLNQLEFEFIEWLESQNTFCNSLVDRIVPGKPKEAECITLENSLGYEDELLIKTEVFRLWAIEGTEKVKDLLSFRYADEGVVITPDINIYKELKLRLLNGTHSFNCGIAFLSGFNLTRDAVEDKLFSTFIKKLVYDEISAAINYDISRDVKEEFASKVLDRFGNPFIDHQWLSITVQYTTKMKMRNVDLLLNHYSNNKTAPVYMSVCFAGFILFMKSVRTDAGKYYGVRNGVEYEIVDEKAEFFYQAWKNSAPEKIAEVVLSNEELWETDLSLLPGFLQMVRASLLDMMSFGVFATVKEVLTNNVSLNEA